MLPVDCVSQLHCQTLGLVVMCQILCSYRWTKRLATEGQWCWQFRKCLVCPSRSRLEASQTLKGKKRTGAKLKKLRPTLTREHLWRWARPRTTPPCRRSPPPDPRLPWRLMAPSPPTLLFRACLRTWPRFSSVPASAWSACPWIQTLSTPRCASVCASRGITTTPWCSPSWRARAWFWGWLRPLASTALPHLSLCCSDISSKTQPPCGTPWKRWVEAEISWPNLHSLNTGFINVWAEPWFMDLFHRWWDQQWPVEQVAQPLEWCQAASVPGKSITSSVSLALPPAGTLNALLKLPAIVSA